MKATTENGLMALVTGTVYALAVITIGISIMFVVINW
jgi:hypothetical protein